MAEQIISLFTAKEIRGLYDTVVKYYAFEYSLIQIELSNIVRGTEYVRECIKTNDNIEYLPDEFQILFIINNIEELIELKEKYSFLDNDILFEVLAFSLNFIPRLIDDSEIIEFADLDYGYDIVMQGEKRRLYEFLLDNERKFNENNSAKTKMTLHYGLDAEIEVGNYNNWLYELIRSQLHDSLTYHGQIEYNRCLEPERPSRAPSFANFIAYNTYLLLMDIIGSEKQLPAEFIRFIIDFCYLANVKLEGRQSGYDGMKDLIKAAKRQYNNEPIPFSLVRL